MKHESGTRFFFFLSEKKQPSANRRVPTKSSSTPHSKCAVILWSFYSKTDVFHHIHDYNWYEKWHVNSPEFKKQHCVSFHVFFPEFAEFFMKNIVNKLKSAKILKNKLVTAADLPIVFGTFLNLFLQCAGFTSFAPSQQIFVDQIFF